MEKGGTAPVVGQTVSRSIKKVAGLGLGWERAKLECGCDVSNGHRSDDHRASWGAVSVCGSVGWVVVLAIRYRKCCHRVTMLAFRYRNHRWVRWCGVELREGWC